LSLMVAAILILGWFKLPKPPEPLTKEDLQEAIANGVHPASENTPQPVVQANSEHPTKADITQMVRSAVAVNPNGLSNIGNDRLNKMAKEAINSLEELQRWQAQDTATDSALKERVGQTKIQDGKGGSRPMTNSEIAPYATAAEQKKKLDTEMRANTKPFMLRVCDLRAEIVSRLILLEGGDWSPHKQIDALFARIKAGEYGPNDVLSAQTSMQEIQKRFEQNRSASIQP